MNLQNVKDFYTKQGVSIENTANGELIGQCPFCLKENHFYISVKMGVFHCHRCKAEGNPLKFLELKHPKSTESDQEVFKMILNRYGLLKVDQNEKSEFFDTCQNLIKSNPEKLTELAEVRKFKDISKAVAMCEKYKVCVDYFNNWIFPLFDIDGSIRGLMRYNHKGVVSMKSGLKQIMKNGKGDVKTSAMMYGHSVGIFGYQDAVDNSDIHTLIVTESPTKTLHLQLNEYDGKNGTLAIGTIGTANLPKDQVTLFKDKIVLFCYDYDFSIDNPGQNGVIKDAKKIRDFASEIRNIIPTTALIQKFKSKGYAKVDLADDYWIEGRTVDEFNKLMKDAKEVEIPTIESSGNSSNVKDVTVPDKKYIPECAFPFDIFPEQLRNTINQFSRAFHVKPEIVASSMLPIIGRLANIRLDLYWFVIFF